MYCNVKDAVMRAKTQRFEALKGKIQRLEVQQDLLRKREEETLLRIEALERENVVLEKVAELFKHLIDKYVYEYAESFSAIITEGLNSIYYDQDLKFRIDVEQKRGRVYATFVLEEGDVEGGPLEAFGGGVAAVISLLLRILVMVKSNMARYLLLDESLASLSEEYVEPCGDFLRKLCAEMGVHILMVTHNRDFVELSDNAYLGDTGAGGYLELRKIR